jgi:Leucine-rich repeat (LRR) protein
MVANQLTGNIPQSIGNLKSLKEIYLSENQLSGNIPQSIGNLKSLTKLSLGYNQLTGFPNSLTALNIPSLSLSPNPMAELAYDANDCVVANFVFRKMGGRGMTIPDDCCNRGYDCTGGRLRVISWAQYGLVYQIPSEIGRLTGLWSLRLYWNYIPGIIPESICALTELGELGLSGNRLTGSLPTCIRNMKSINFLMISGNNFTGPFPDIFGSLTSLRSLEISGNKFSGPIPASISIPTGLFNIMLHANEFSGYPSSLKTVEARLKSSNGYCTIWPNPKMSDVPYDVVQPVPLGALSELTLNAFLRTPVTRKVKRQMLSTSAPVSAAELLKMCNLNNVVGQNVAAGCVAGIYNTYCQTPTNPTLLKQCQDTYDRAFGASVFKPLSDVCPAWKQGPRSAACAAAINSFSRPTFGFNGVSIPLNSGHARELVNTVFASKTYAPCVAATCKW